MTRRLAVLAAALGGLLVLPSCSTFDGNVAARVNGTKIDDELVKFFLAVQHPDDKPSAASGGDARNQLTQLIKARIGETVAAQVGADLDGPRSAIRTRLEAQLNDTERAEWNKLSPTSQALVLDANGGVSTALANTPAAAPTNLEQLYAEPESTGFMCLRFMVFQTRAEAEAAAAKLAGGAAFADVANSISPNANGGILAPDGTTECVSLTGVLNAGPEITHALLAASPGVPTPVVTIASSDSQTGSLYYLFVHRPYGEIKDQLAAVVGQAPQEAALQAAYATAHVSVASRFGRWDPDTQSVAALT